ncbi:alpha/beta hydrolase fold domain-containing protein [Microbacterium sp. NM3R9]|uniref:alpha/beta hydrolase fold domain-containing protein n=1 Tax=Microbacterium thalli TaxID=3027921 RepID=UPI002365D244|nr:alpha/beta hydrolase fold domain-containing protein [Microbacterium thalli]MDN8547839.1 alpha/beta hydrolase fold domain-containing protein [Microbacterium thalli]
MSETTPYSAADGLVRVYPGTASTDTGPTGTGLVWMHGGGFAYGDLDMPEADAVARGLAARGTTVVSVDYRLAPIPAGWDGADDAGPDRSEHRFPAASDDVLRAWRWAGENAERLGVSRLAIGGASAGANLAAGATLRLLGSGDPAPALVVLAYPTLLAVQPAPGLSLRAALDAHPEFDRFGPDVVRAMYENYLGRPVVGAPVAAVPGLASVDELAAFPPTFIVTSEIDELSVSAEVFAATLRTARRSVDLVVEPGTDHGHLNRPELPAAAASIDRIARRLAELSAS